MSNMEYKCKICNNSPSRQNCSHIINLDNNEISITNCYIDETSKQLIKNLNCPCIEETFFINKHLVCDKCTSKSAEFLCRECEEKYCAKCARSKESLKHQVYETLWKESRCPENDEADIHYLIHIDFIHVQNGYHLLFKEPIQLFNKFSYLKILNLKGLHDLYASVKEIEKCSSKLFIDMIEKRRMTNQTDIRNMLQKVVCIEKQISLYPFLEKDSETLDLKPYFSGCILKDKINIMIVNSGKSISVFLSIRNKIISLLIAEDGNISIKDYSLEFSKMIGIFHKCNEMFSVMMPSNIGHPANSSSNNGLSNISQSNAPIYYHIDVVDYLNSDNNVTKQSSNRLNYSSLNGGIPNNTNGASVSGYLTTQKKTIQNINFIGNYLVCCFNYEAFTSLEIFTCQESKYSATRVICQFERFILLDSFNKGNETLKICNYSIISFEDKLEILSIPQGEILFVINTLSQVFKMCLVVNDSYAVDKYQIYRLKEEQNCFHSANSVYVKEKIKDIDHYKDYIIILTEASCEVRLYSKRELIYLQAVNLNRSLYFLKTIITKDSEFLLNISEDFKLSITTLNSLKDINNSFIKNKVEQ